MVQGRAIISLGNAGDAPSASPDASSGPGVAGPGRVPDEGFGGWSSGSWSDEPLRAALLLLLAVSVVGAFAAVALAAHYDVGLLVPMAAFAGIGLADIALGVLAWWRRPHNGTGLLLCWLGLLILLATAGNADVPAVRALGFAVGQGPIAALLHLLLAFPSGRLGSRSARALAVAGYAVMVGLDLVRLWSTRADLFDPTASGPEVVQTWQHPLAAVVLIAASMHLIARFRRTPAGTGWTRRPTVERRALAAVYAWGIAMLWFFPLSSNILAPRFHWDPVTLFIAQITPFLAMPVVFAVALLRGGFARTARIEELAAALSTSRHGRRSLRDAVARALGDPSATITFPAPTAPLPPGRGRIVVSGSAGPLAAVDYDTTLIADPRPVRAVVEVLSLALQREQLLAEVLTSRQQVIASRTRIVQAADDERRRVVSDLHDVLQARLVLAAMKIGTLAARTAPEHLGGRAPTLADIHTASETIRRDVDDTITELRHLIDGLMPATLADLGLRAAVDELLARTPLTTGLTWDLTWAEPATPTPDEGNGRTARSGAVELPEPVATTAYLIVVEAVTNAVKHSGATRLDVHITRHLDRLELTITDDGSGGATLGRESFDAADPFDPPERRGRPRTGLGLRSITDRADTLGGTVTLTSPSGEGTHLRVELPLPSTRVPEADTMGDRP